MDGRGRRGETTQFKRGAKLYAVGPALLGGKGGGVGRGADFYYQWIVESGEWIVESGEWRVENGEWRVESGEWIFYNKKKTLQLMERLFNYSL